MHRAILQVRGRARFKDSLVDTLGEILAILKPVKVLLLTSVGLGFLQQLLKPKKDYYNHLI